MLERSIRPLTYLISGIILLTLGVTSIFISKNILELMIIFLSIILSLSAILEIIRYIKNKSKDKKILNTLIKSFTDIVFAILIISNKKLFIGSFSIIAGIYLYINMLIQLINYIIYIKYSIPGRIMIFTRMMFSLILGSILISHPVKNVHYVQITAGIYMLALGLSRINDFIIEITPIEKENQMKKHIRIPLPLFLTFFIPHRLINLVNEILTVRDDDPILDISKKEQKPDLEVIIHLSESGTAALGHIEVCFEDKIYSYGNYDKHSRKLFNSIGDGVLLIADRNKYFKYNTNKLNRYLVSYGFSLTKTQIRELKNRINFLISNNTIDYYPDLALYEQGKIPKGNFNEISSDLYKEADATFKKIVKGKNKKFFVLKNNCAVVVNYILGSIGKNIIDINGIITPGTYYEYLNNEFSKKNSNVISRKIYTKKDFK